MNDGSTITTFRLLTVGLWVMMGCLMLAAWATWFAGLDTLPIMLFLTGCPIAVAAATMQIRCYSARICSLVRVTGGLDRPDAEVRAMR